MADQELIQEKIGEALGLEKAAQKAVEELDSRGLLKSEHMLSFLCNSVSLVPPAA